jgi:hypothetical protein
VKDAEELIRLIQESMDNGAGHVNVEIGEDGVKTSVTKSQTLCGKNMACQVPTLHKGIDEDED